MKTLRKVIKKILENPNVHIGVIKEWRRLLLSLALVIAISTLFLVVWIGEPITKTFNFLSRGEASATPNRPISN